MERLWPTGGSARHDLFEGRGGTPIPGSDGKRSRLDGLRLGRTIHLSSPLEVLLVSDILVYRHHHVESGCFRLVQELAIIELSPAQFAHGRDFMADEKASNAVRSTVVKKNAHQFRAGKGVRAQIR